MEGERWEASQPRRGFFNTFFAPRRHFLALGSYGMCNLKRAEGDELVAISQAGTVSKLMCHQPTAVRSLSSSIEDIAVVWTCRLGRCGGSTKLHLEKYGGTMMPQRMVQGGSVVKGGPGVSRG